MEVQKAQPHLLALQIQGLKYTRAFPQCRREGLLEYRSIHLEVATAKILYQMPDT